MTKTDSAVGIGDITPAEALERSRDGAVLLDVREEIEYTSGHAPESIWVPLGDLRDGATLPSEAIQQVMVICRSGGRSQHAAELLAKRGMKVFNVAGGMQAWAQAGLPVRSSDGQTGQIV